MKKLSILLVGVAVALSAAAGVNNTWGTKMVNNRDMKAKVEVGDMSAHKHLFKRGSDAVLPATQLRAMDWSVRPAAPKLKSENTIMWDFEDEAQLEGWSIIDNDGDGYGWEYANTEGQVTHSGTGVVSSASYVNNPSGTGGTALTPDNWLISPQVTLDGNLVFYAVGQDPSFASEVFAVYVAVGEPAGIEDFVKISADITVNGTMKEYIFDLTQFEGQVGCIAFRHYNVTDQFRLNIDDVTITTEEVIPEPEPEAPEVITEIPERCQTYTYYRNSGTILSHWLIGIYARPTAGKFVVAFDPENNDVYIQNPIWAYNTLNTWIKGTYDASTGIITVPTGQYIGWDDENQYGLELVWGSSFVHQQGEDPETGEPNYYMGTEIDERTTEFYLRVDGDEIYLLDTEGDIYADYPEWGNATGLMLIWSDDKTWEAFEFANRYTGEELPFGTIAIIVPAVPANPSADRFEDGGNENGYTKFYFTLPETDVDGNKIDFELLSYSMWVKNDNGPELFVFKEEDYFNDILGMGDLTEIPYSVFYGGYDFYDYMLYLYRTNAPGYDPLFTQDIGIQAHYTVDGVKNSSEIAWLYGTHVAVDEVNAGKTVASVRYYNVAGQEMAQPSGMTIQITTYTDGTTSAVKVVK